MHPGRNTACTFSYKCIPRYSKITTKVRREIMHAFRSQDL